MRKEERESRRERKAENQQREERESRKEKEGRGGLEPGRSKQEPIDIDLGNWNSKSFAPPLWHFLLLIYNIINLHKTSCLSM